MSDHADPMPPMNSIAFQPLSTTEIERLRVEGRRDNRFDALLRRALRLQVLAGFGRPSLDPEARVGIDRAQSTALLRLADCPPADYAQWRLKDAVLRHAGGRDGNLGDMLAAALARDAARLGIDASHVSTRVQGREAAR